MDRFCKKVEDGKMVCIEAEKEDCLKNVKITGDFFLQPPNKLEEFSEILEGLGSDINREELIEKFNEVEADLIGFSREDLADLVMEVLK